MLVDCRDYHDPEFGRDSHHLGWKDETFAGLVNNDKATGAIIDQVIEGIYLKWMSKKHVAKLTNGLVIALMCKSGFHRSLVSAKCVHHVLQRVHDNVEVFHLSQGDWSTRGCQKSGIGRCPLCQYQSRTQLSQLALALYQQNFDERLVDALGLDDSIRTRLDATRSASLSKAPATVMNTPPVKAVPKIVRIISKKNASKSSRSRLPSRHSSASNFACIGASEHASGNHRTSSACGTPEDITGPLDSAWQSYPYLTTDSEVSTTFSDLDRSPQGKIIKLIGRSSVEWRGVTWNNQLSELCMRAIEEANVTFDADDDSVLTELHTRMTTFRTRKQWRMRTKEEIDAIIAFWWKLQTYRRRYLKRNGRVDTTEAVLCEADIGRVKKNWQDDEMYWDLSDEQRKLRHLPSLYHAALNNKSGWSAAANATIKYHLPQLPHTRTTDGVTQHIQRWCCDLLEWLKKFARYQICRVATCTRPALPR